jgi:hypothetical protein
MKVLLAALVHTALAADKSVTTDDGTVLKILGQSGKMELSHPDLAGDARVQIKSVTEVDKLGDAVGTSGSTKHSFNSFASQDFSFGEVTTGPYNGGSSLRATSVPFTCKLLNGAADFGVQSHLMLEKGSVTEGNETSSISVGSLKFSFNISGWEFCTAGGKGNRKCSKGGKDQNGTALDVVVYVDAKGADPVPAPSTNSSSNATNATALPLAGGGKLELARRLRVDGEWKTMEDGFPKSVTKGKQTQITIRFPKFASAVYYDPIVTLASAGTAGNGASARAPALGASLMVAALVALQAAAM